MTQQLEAIIFDMDGVLVDTEEYHYYAWAQVAQALSVPFGSDQMHRFLGRRRRDCLMDLLNGRVLDETEIQHYLDLKDQYFQDAAARMNRDALLPGVTALIEDARQAKLKLGVASSSANARLILERTGLLDAMEVVGDGTTVVRSKPAPDLFLWVAGALLTRPQHLVVFEDSSVGLQAARTAGMFSVAVGQQARAMDAAYHIDDLSQITVSALQSLLQEHQT